jgi:endonuclease YncB( thermonuclease family)
LHLRALTTLVAAVMFQSPGTPGFAADFFGQARVIAGDTIEIQGTSIRLFGIAAPASGQLCRSKVGEPYRCGQLASGALSDLIAIRPVDCVQHESRRWGRVVAVCTLAGIDLADWMVRNGHALDWPKYSGGDYGAAQDEAKHAERGIWSGSFVEPWRYRQCMRSGGKPASCSDQKNDAAF